jgi:hypothetical protein
MGDTTTPLASAAQLTEGPFADLVRSVSTQTLTDWLMEATRACETECHRRLSPFTGIIETHRAAGMDPDEYTDAANVPMDIQSTVNRSYAAALGVTTLVRHCWLDQYAPLYQEYWSYSDLTVEVIRSYGGSQILTSTQYTGPELDSGHVWFQLGQFIPIGSLLRVTYSGGYTTVPSDLVRACKYMTASIALRELDPLRQSGHNPDDLQDLAVSWLSPYQRAG